MATALLKTRDRAEDGDCPLCYGKHTSQHVLGCGRYAVCRGCRKKWLVAALAHPYRNQSDKEIEEIETLLDQFEGVGFPFDGSDGEIEQEALADFEAERRQLAGTTQQPVLRRTQETVQGRGTRTAKILDSQHSSRGKVTTGRVTIAQRGA